MPINEDIYKTSKTWKPSNNGDLIFKTTDGFTKILTDNENWQSDTIWDNSNVYTTYNPEKYGINLFGSAISNIEFHLEDGFNKLNEISFEESTDLSRVNLRYCLVSKDGLSMELNMLRWTNKKTNISNFQYVAGSTVDYKGVYASGNADFDGDYLFLRRYSSNIKDIFFVNEIDRNKIFLSCSISTIGFDVNGNQVNVKDFTYDELNNTSGDLWEKGYVTDESGNKRFINEVIVHLALRNDYENDTQSNFIVTNMPVYDENRKELNLSGYALCILVEKVVDDSVFYSLFPITSFGSISAYNKIYTSNTYHQQFMDGSPDLGYHYVYGDNEDNYNKAFTLFPTGTWSYTDLRTTSGKRFLIDNHVVYFTVYTKPSGGNTFGRKIITLQEVYRYLSCFLVPFYVTYPRTSVNTYTIYKRDNPKLYLGIRNDETGEVEGDYIPFIWGSTPVEEGLRPDDFEPYDPYNPSDTPVTPDDWGNIPLGYLPSNVTNAFVKNYVMNDVAITFLGQNLWKGLQTYDPTTDKNMINNFYLLKPAQSAEQFQNLDLSLVLSNVIDYFVALRYYPIPSFLSYSSSNISVKSLTVGTSSTEIPVDIGSSEYTGPSAYRLGRNTFTIDGGVITRNELLNQSKMFNSFLDYEPYVSCSIYIPYCGTIELQPSTIFDQNLVSLALTYAVDVSTGSITAILVKNGVVNYPIAMAQGTIGFEQIISGSNFNSQMINAMLNSQIRQNNITKSIFGSAANAMGGIAQGNLGGFVGFSNAGFNASMDYENLKLQYPMACGTSPLSVGTPSSLAGCLQPTVAYIQVVKHSSPIVGQYGDIFGYTGNIMGTIGSQNGFFKAINPRLDGIPCNEYERDEIYNLLTSGVYWQ